MDAEHAGSPDAPPDAASFRVEVMAGNAAEPARAAWAALARHCLDPCVFLDPAFAIPALDHLATRSSPALVLVWRTVAEAEPALAALAMVALHGPVRWRGASAWTHAQATAAIPLLHRQYGAAAIPHLLEAVARLSGRPTALLLTGVEVGGPTERLFDHLGHVAVALDRRSRAILPAGTTGAKLTAKARKNLRQQARHMAADSAVELRSFAGPDAAAGFDRFLALEASGWKGRRGTALLADEARAAFARSAVGGLAASGQARIDLLFMAERVVAGGVFLRSGSRGFFWKTAYDEMLAAHSPGVQFVRAASERQSQETGLDWTDSCAVPGHSMIDRLWPDRVDVVDLLVATKREAGWRFAMVVRAEMMRRAVRRAAKNLLVCFRATARALERRMTGRPVG